MKKKRIASIDYGLARIGLAITDENQIIAQSLGTIMAERRAKESAKKIANHLQAYDLEEIVVGLPIHLNGKEGFLADETRAFIAHLKEEVLCPITTIEERMTTLQAERSLREANMSRKKRAKVIDGVAAVLILQNYLELKSFSKNSSLDE